MTALRVYFEQRDPKSKTLFLKEEKPEHMSGCPNTF
jgi:hypothetical protein